MIYFITDLVLACNIISYALLESGIRPDIQPKSSRSHEARGGWGGGGHLGI